MNELFFEELEKAEEFGPVSDFAGAAIPYILVGVAVAVVLSISSTDKSKEKKHEQ